MSANDNKISDLEHEILEGKVKGVRAQVMALGDTLHGRIDDLEKKNDIQFKHVKDALEEIKDTGNKTFDQALETNGRVTGLEAEKLPEKIEKLEKETKLIRFIHKYPKLTIGMTIVMYLITIKEIRDVVISVLGRGFDWLIKLFI